jgi:hypothetical protein
MGKKTQQTAKVLQFRVPKKVLFGPSRVSDLKYMMAQQALNNHYRLLLDMLAP